MTPKDYVSERNKHEYNGKLTAIEHILQEKACEQPVLIANVVSMTAMLAVHGVGMFAAMTKFANRFNPSKIQAKLRYNQRLSKMNRH